MFDVEITTTVGATVCRARLRLEDNYPMMEIIDVHEDARNTDH